MPLSKHSIDVLEAGYRLDSTAGDWLRGLLRAMHGASLMGGATMRAGAFGFEVSPDGESFQTHDYIVRNAPDELARFMRQRHVALSPAEVAFRFCGRPVVCATLSQRRLPMSAEQRQMGLADYLGFQVTDTSGVGCGLFFELPERKSLRHNQVMHWQALAYHVRAGLRLRSRLGGREPWAVAEAVIDVEAGAHGGAVVHAHSAAAPRDVREMLRHRALAVDRMRTASRRGDDAQVLSAWDGLLAGEWTLVEQFDSDGRRFYLAMHNPPESRHLLRLTPGERAVVELVADGWTNREIAGELGRSESSVNKAVVQALAKLRVRSRVEMAVLAGDLERSSMSSGGEELLLMRLPRNFPEQLTRRRLTPAESDVVMGILRGFSNRGIAAQRSSKVRTVANQIKSLFDKLGAGTRTELAALLV